MGFYAYLWLREDGTPYYAGKGTGKRAFVRRENHWPPANPNRVLIFARATEAEAFATEKELIANWGRKDIGTGRLQNRTDGGENPPRAKKGRKVSELAHRHFSEGAKRRKYRRTGWTHSAESLQKMSRPRSVRWKLMEETKQRQRAAARLREAKLKADGVVRGQKTGFKHSDESKIKMSLAAKGRVFSEQTKLRLSMAQQERRRRERNPNV